MSIVSNPNITINIESRGGVVGIFPQNILAIGQKSALGSAPADVVVTNIGNAGQEDSLFGTRSMLATMCRTVKKYNTVSRLDALPLADPTVGAAAATATITIDTAATANGNFSIAVQSERYYTFTIGILSTDTTVEIATNLANVINASTTILFTANSGGTNVVTLTASHDGTELNDTSIKVLETVNGLTVTTTAFTGGAGAVTLPDLATALGVQRYQHVIFPASYGFTDIKPFIDGRYNVQNAILDGVVLSVATVVNTTTAISTSQDLNSKNIVYFGMPNRSTSSLKGSPMVELNVTTAAYFAAVNALRLEPGQNISQYLAGTGNPSTFGGPARATSPLHQTPFEDLAVITGNQGWSTAEQDELTAGGVSYFGNNSESSSIVVGDVVTTYRTTAGGVTDSTFHFLNAVLSSSIVREFYFNNTKARYIQTVLSDRVVDSPNKIATQTSIKGYLVKLFTDLGESPYTLVQSSEAAKKFFKDTTKVTVNIGAGSVNIVMFPPLVGQLRSLKATLKIGFTLDTN